MTLIDGKALAQKQKEILKSQVQQFKAETNITPKLTAIIVGDDPASKVYVGSKHKACALVGIDSDVVTLPSTVSEAELLALIDKLNNDKTVNAVLVQLPLPDHIDKQKYCIHLKT